MHTYTGYGCPREDMYEHAHTHTNTLAHIRTHILSFLAPEALTLPVCLPSPMSCIYSPTPFPLSQASPMWGRSWSWGGRHPRKRTLLEGAVTEGSLGVTLCF